MNSKQFFSFANVNPLLWDYYSFGLWLLLALKLRIRIIGRSNVVGIKLEPGGVWKYFPRLIMFGQYVKLYERFLLLRFKMFCYVLFYNFLLDMYSFCWLNKVLSSIFFEFICDPLHSLAKRLRYECYRKYAWGEIP